MDLCKVVAKKGAVVQGIENLSISCCYLLDNEELYCSSCFVFLGIEGGSSIACEFVGCAAKYCSITCRQYDEKINGHWLCCLTIPAIKKFRTIASSHERMALQLLCKFVATGITQAPERNVSAISVINVEIKSFLDSFGSRRSNPVPTKNELCLENTLKRQRIESSSDGFHLVMLALCQALERRNLISVNYASVASCLDQERWERLIQLSSAYALLLQRECPLAESIRQLPQVTPKSKRYELFEYYTTILRHANYDVGLNNWSLAAEELEEVPCLVQEEPAQRNFLAREREVVCLAQAASSSTWNPLNSMCCSAHVLAPISSQLIRSHVPSALAELSIVKGRSPSLSLIALSDIYSMEGLSIAFDTDAIDTQCDCLKCEYFGDPRKYLQIANSRSSSTSAASSVSCQCPFKLYDLGQNLMQYGLFGHCAKLMSQFILHYDEVCPACIGKVDIGDAYNALAASLLDMEKWELSQAVWKFGYLRSPMNSFLASVNSKLTSYLLYNDVLSTDDAIVRGNDFYQIRMSSNVSSKEFFTAFLHSHRRAPAVSNKRVYISRTPVISTSDCEWIIAASEKHADSQNGWATSRHYSVPTTDIPIHAIPSLCSWFNSFFTQVAGPALAAQYAQPNFRCKIAIHDAFVVKYDATEEGDQIGHSQRYLPFHQDQSSHSFVIALNDNYVGGGTYFSDIGRSLKTPAGHLVTFSGTVLHGGDAVISGCRYIIAVFLHMSVMSAATASEESFSNGVDLLQSLCFGSQDNHKVIVSSHFKDGDRNCSESTRRDDSEKDRFSFGFSL